MKTLFVTSLLRMNAGGSGGIDARQRLLMQAVRLASSEVEVLLLDHHDPAYGGGPHSPAHYQAAADRAWGSAMPVTICRREAPRPNPHWLKLIAGRCGLQDISPFSSTAGSTQREAFEAAVKRLDADLIFVHRLACMPPVMNSDVDVPVLLDLDDIEHIAMRRQLATRGGPWRQPAAWAQLPIIEQGEYAALRRARLSLVCSQQDARWLMHQVPTAKVMAVPNATPMPTVVERSTQQVLLMVGQFAYEPNRHGLEHFVHRIWPRIRAAVPECRLQVAGGGGSGLSFASRPPDGIDLLGFVPDISDAYRSASVVVCPIYSGGGTRVKIIEAAGHGMPIVSTPIGAEGLEFSDGQDILLAADDDRFAQACIRLFKEPDLAQRLGTAARTRALERYDLKAVVESLANVLREQARATRAA